MAAPYQTKFHSYDSTRTGWSSTRTATHELDRNAEFDVISWNLDAFSPGVAARAQAAVDHLQKTCGDAPSRTIIMLQEVCQKSLDAILQHEWVQHCFSISELEPPKSIISDIAGPSFVLRKVEWQNASYFNIMLLSTDLPIVRGFRVPFTTRMSRDILAADILLADFHAVQRKRDVLRLCTTHLESLYEGRAYRPGQLALISSICKGTPPLDEYNVVAGLVAGDMNAIDKTEDEYPKSADVGLSDVWEGGPEEAVPVLKNFQRDFTNGQARGNTWGYQSSNGKRKGKRMDKILYTGSLETVPLTHGEQLTRVVKRLGVDLKTLVDAYKLESTYRTLTRSGKIVSRTDTDFVSVEKVEAEDSLYSDWLNRATRVTEDAWVSDHYGLLAKLKLV